MRKRWYEIIEISKKNDVASSVYDLLMIISIFASLVPLVFKEDSTLFTIIDKVTASIFIMDYLSRWFTADIKTGKGWKAFFRYPFTFMAIVDLLSILPSLVLLNPSLKVLKVFRLLRTLRTLKVLKIFRAFRYSKNVKIIINVFKDQKESLSIVGGLAIGYILLSALVIFNVEPDTFDSFFDAIYWATVSLTTVGYGDIYATSTAGKVITMISALMGVAIVALPAGIITAGYMKEINATK